MSINDILDALITSATADKNTLDDLIAQLQHTTITSSDDELYDAPTFDDVTGLWTLAQNTANVDGLFVGCYKLPATGIDSYISNVTVIDNKYTAPASPTAPASVTPSVGSPIDLTSLASLEGQAFNSFCIRSATAFEITLRVSKHANYNEWCRLQLGTYSQDDWTPLVYSAYTTTYSGGKLVGGFGSDGSGHYAHIVYGEEIVTGTITSIQISYEWSRTVTGGDNLIVLQINGGQVAVSGNLLGSGTGTLSWTGSQVNPTIRVLGGVNVSSGGEGYCNIIGVELHGTADNPYDIDNCP